MAQTLSCSILLVDDDLTAIHALWRALEDYRDMRFATSVADAMAVIKDRVPDLILLDANLANESGFDLCAHLKASEVYSQIPIIFVTATDTIDFETRAFDAGAADFVAKPIHPLIVQHRVRTHLRLVLNMRALEALSLTDSLTSLPNRRAFDQRLREQWRDATRTNRPLSLLMVDVDFFKALNDSAGHPEGDRCLAMIGRVLQTACKRPGDFAARLGGEEFGVLLPNTTPEGAAVVAERIRHEVERAAFPHNESTLGNVVTVSIGVSTRDGCTAHGDMALPARGASQGSFAQEDLIEVADRALYIAKSEGRNRVGIMSLEDSLARPRTVRPSTSPPVSERGSAFEVK